MTDDKKRGNGQGSVEVLADGRARIRVWVDGKRQQLGPIQPDEATAQAILAAWLAERGEGDIVASSKLTLGIYGDRWLDLREINGSRRREKVRSIAGERSVWSRHVRSSSLAAKVLAEIRPLDVEAFALELRSRKAMHSITYGRGPTKRVELTPTTRPLSRAQQREALRLVRAVLDHATRAELLERNPAEGVEVARGSTSPRDLSEDWLRWPEVRQLLGCDAIDARDRRAYACAIGLALRLGDLKGIELSRVELDVEVPGPGIVVRVEKTQRWHRVPVMPWLVPIVREQLESLPKKARYLFPREDGDRYAKHYDFGWGEDRERVVDREGNASIEREPSALEIAGVKRRVRFHDLRGTCATHLALGTWGRTWSLHEIQAMLAHSDQRVTERYVRRAVDMLAAAARDTPGCPGLPLRATGTTGVSAENREAPGPGLEPGTIRLTDASPIQRSRDVTESAGQRLGSAAAALVSSPSTDAVEAYVTALEAAAAELAERARAIGEGGALVARLAIEDAACELASRREASRPELTARGRSIHGE